MMPADSHKMIRSVNIHHNTYSTIILGFSFFDKEGALLWEIGVTSSWFKVKTVLIAENEVIVGVVAKISPYVQPPYTGSLYTGFQFQIATKQD
jgi:hypothetical protein